MTIATIQENKDAPIFGQVFVQAPQYAIGLSSYHFDAPDNIYINFQKWKELKDYPSLPVKKNFVNVKFNPEKGVFIGLIDWTTEGGSPFSPNEMYWLYLMVFSKDYSKITGGYITNDGGERVTSFSKDLQYINLSLALVKGVPDPMASIKKHDAQEIDLCLQAAEQGDLEAQFRLSVMFLSNNDGDQANFWLKKAAERGHVGAQFAFGLMHVECISGLDLNYSEAANWFYKAAEQGNAEAKYYLGVIFENGGYGVHQNEDEAIAWYSKAAKQGFPKAIKKLGL